MRKAIGVDLFTGSMAAKKGISGLIAVMLLFLVLQLPSWSPMAYLNQGWLSLMSAQMSSGSDQIARLAQAEQIFARLLAVDHLRVSVLDGLVQVSLIQGNMTTARRLLQTVTLAGTERGKQRWQAIGNWAASQNNPDLAVEAWQQSGFWDNPQSAWALTKAAEYQWQAGHEVLARMMLRQAATHPTTDAEYYRYLGDIFERSVGDLDAAASQYQQVVQLPSASAQDWLRLAGLCRKTKQWSCAWKSAQTAMTLAQGSEAIMDTAMYEMASVAAFQDPPTDGIKMLETFVAAYPNSPASLTLLGSFYLGRSRLDDAERVLRQALGVARPGGAWEAWIQSLLGDIAWRRGDYPQAEQRVMRSVEIAPGTASYLIQLGDLYARTARPDQARMAYQRAILAKPIQAQRVYIQQQLDRLVLP